MDRKECLKVCKENGFIPYRKKTGRKVVYAYSRVFEGMEIDKHILISMGYEKAE